MKKYFNIRTSMLLAVLGLSLVACAEGDLVFDEIVDNTTRGAVLRGFDVISTELDFDAATQTISPGEEFSIILQVQDPEGGALLQEVQVFISYDDNTTEDEVNAKEEILFATLPASSFTQDEFGFPRTAYQISGEEFQTALGLENSQLAGEDNFMVRFELLLTDGRIFSNFNSTGTLEGAFFTAPFAYTMDFNCLPSAPTAGTWTVEALDTSGDGWDGGSLQIVLDGGEAIEIAAVDAELEEPTTVSQTYTFEVPEGTETISITYSEGDSDDEVAFNVTSANGIRVIQQGTNPPDDEEFLDFCPNNL